MDRTERFYRISQMLETRRLVSRDDFLEELGISLATFKRDLEYLRTRLDAPIIWDPVHEGYRFDPSPAAGPKAELPGLWFNASEAHALLTMEHLLETLQPGLMKPQIEPLKTRIRALLGQGDHAPEEIGRHIRVLPQGQRVMAAKHFELISHTVLTRKRLRVRHYSRQRDDITERELSPQRLVHYRDNWYLDAWCHLRQALRTFALDTLEQAELIDKNAKHITDKALDAELGAGYGIFAGTDTECARLRFTPERARWIVKESWHPEQTGHFDDAGYYLLEVPYSDDRELIMDILKFGLGVEVLAPAKLRKKVAESLKAALKQY